MILKALLHREEEVKVDPNMVETELSPDLSQEELGRELVIIAENLDIMLQVAPSWRIKTKLFPLKASASTAETSDSDNDPGIFTASASPMKSTMWVIDSGASYHMTPDRHSFSTYRQLDGGEVLMGNNASCRMIGIGTVKIRMFDGVVRTLCDVRHVRDLRRNLISIGALCNFGLKCVIEKDSLKITNGSLIVMKGVKAGNLYLLKGTTVVAETASVIDSVDSDSTRLWHFCTGHIGECSLEVLRK